jgi:hypothetical protein
MKSPLPPAGGEGGGKRRGHVHRPCRHVLRLPPAHSPRKRGEGLFPRFPVSLPPCLPASPHPCLPATRHLPLATLLPSGNVPSRHHSTKIVLDIFAYIMHIVSYVGNYYLYRDYDEMLTSAR